MLIDPPPKESAANAPRAMRDTYLKWLSNHIMVHCIMRAAMNDELSRKFEEAQLEDMIQLLNESFSTSEDAERHKTCCTVFNAHM